MLIFLEDVGRAPYQKLYNYRCKKYPKLPIFGVVSSNDVIIAVDSKYTNLSLENMRAYFGEDVWKKCKVKIKINNPRIQPLNKLPLPINVEPRESIIAVKFNDTHIYLKYPEYNYKKFELDILLEMAKPVVAKFPLAHAQGRIHVIERSVLSRHNLHFTDTDLYETLKEIYHEDWWQMELPWLPVAYLENECKNTSS